MFKAVDKLRKFPMQISMQHERKLGIVIDVNLRAALLRNCMTFEFAVERVETLEG